MPNALHHAAAEPDTGYLQVKQLIEEGKMNVDTQHTEYGTRAVEFAAQTGSLQTLKYLIETAKANLNAHDTKQNLLFWAATNKPEITDYLTDTANKIVEQFNDSTIALHIAAYRGELELVKTILAKNPNEMVIENVHGQNALYWAALRNRLSIIHYIQTYPAFNSRPTISKFDNALRGFSHAAMKRAHICEEEEIEAELLEYQEAKQCLTQIVEKTNADYQNLIDCHFQLALILYQKDNYDEAEKTLQACFDYHKKIENPTNRIDITPVKNCLALIKEQQQFCEQLKPWGFEPSDVDRNGNCFFLAAQKQLASLNLPCTALSAKELREKTVDHIRSHRDAYEGFIDENFDDYIAELGKPDTWVDHISILAFSRTFNLTLAILKNDGTNPEIFKRANEQATLYLGYQVGLHYQSLRARPDWKKRKFVEFFIGNAEPDHFQVNSRKRKHPEDSDASANESSPKRQALGIFSNTAPVKADPPAQTVVYQTKSSP